MMGFNFTPVVSALLLLNLIVFIFGAILPFHPESIFALYNFQSPYFKPLQLFTYMFLHSGLGHIISNSLGLFVFGPQLEALWGGKRFLIYYMACGIGAGIIILLISNIEINNLAEHRQRFFEDPEPGQMTAFLKSYNMNRFEMQKVIEWYEEAYQNPEGVNQAKEFVNRLFAQTVNGFTVGASGAIFGIILAFGIIFAHQQISLILIPIPFKAFYLALAYAVYEYMKGINRIPGDQVSHIGHLGGMLVGGILIYLWHGRNR